jgi:HTH-type transcriptional regulator/antitoxin HigA
VETLTSKTIKTPEQYDLVINKIETLLNSEPDSPEFELLEVLSILADEYENKTMPMPKLDPIEAIRYEMEEQGLLQKDMVKYLGSKSKVSEVLNRKTGLTIKMMKALHRDLGISAHVLLSD